MLTKKKCSSKNHVFDQKFPKKKFDRPKKYFLKKLRNFLEHQYRLKISLRIEWEHSQPLKITLKYSNLHPMKLYQILPWFCTIKKAMLFIR